jgi:hypothetical protein
MAAGREPVLATRVCACVALLAIGLHLAVRNLI